MFEAIERGDIRALWVMGTNPAVSLPRADAIRAAMRKLDLLVISENVASTDTVASGTHVLLPAAAWGEKDGTVTNSERRISRQRAFLPLAGEAKPDWWIVSEVARRLGHGAAFAYRGAADIFREHAALSAFENDGGRDFDIGGLAGLDDASYERLEPVQWPVRNGCAGRKRLFGDGGFFTGNGRARFIAIAALAEAGEGPLQAAAEPTLLLNTGRVRDQWHTMTRTGLSPRLAGHTPAPMLDVHPDDALRLGLEDGGLARLRSGSGEAVLPVRVSAAQRPGEVFAPIHWNDETAGGARVGALVHSLTDPYSGQPDSKATPVSIAPAKAASTGFVMARRRRALPDCSSWAWAAIDDGFTAALASDVRPSVLIQQLSAAFEGDDRIAYTDIGKGVTRLAVLQGGRLEAVVFLADAGSGVHLPDWRFLRRFWTSSSLTAFDRLMLLSGQDSDAAPGCGPTVCACFGVGRDAIVAAIRDGAGSVDGIGLSLKAGTNCGSCIPELKKLLAGEAVAAN
jgi:assimilatory nitrate reductase catalytic subunit